MKKLQLLFFVPVVIGYLILTGGSKAPEPKKKVEAQVRYKVQARRVTARALDSRLEGYGEVKADRLWRAVPQVGGLVVAVHPRLQTGEKVRQGEMLFEIEATDYQLESQRIGHENRALQSEIAQLSAREAELRQSLKVALQNRQLLEKEARRYQTLFEQGAVAATATEARQREVLTLQRQVEEIEANLATLPAQRNALRSRIEAGRSAQQRQGLQASRTRVVAPFNGRLGEVHLEVGQVVRAGDAQFSLQGSDRLRVEARFPSHQFADFEAVDATVIYAGEELSAQLAPLREEIDPQSRTVALQLLVSARPQLALLPGALVEVRLNGRPHPRLPVVPRTAMHQGSVFLVDEQDRLQRRKVEIAFRQGDLVAIKSGLKEGERLVLTDPGLTLEGGRLEVEEVR